MGRNGRLKSCSCKIPSIQPGNLLNLILSLSTKDSNHRKIRLDKREKKYYSGVKLVCCLPGNIRPYLLISAPCSEPSWVHKAYLSQFMGPFIPFINCVIM